MSRSAKRARVLSRRDFLQLMGVAAGGAAVSSLLGACGGGDKPVPQPAPNLPDKIGGMPKLPPKPVFKRSGTRPKPKMKRGTLIGAGHQTSADGRQKRFTLTTLNLDKDGSQPNIFAVEGKRGGFFGHGVVPNPLNPSQVALFEKRGEGACYVDLTEGRVLDSFLPSEGCYFYGHGAWSLDGSVVYDTEYRVDGQVGLIAVRDAKTFRKLREFPTHGELPHDCTFADDGKTLAITNGGGKQGSGTKPNVAYVDVESGELVDKLEFDNPKLGSGHLAVAWNGDLAVGSAEREGLKPKVDLGGVSLRPAGGDWRTMTEPAEVTGRLAGETLSLCINEVTGVVTATNVWADIVTFWDMKSGNFLGKLEIEQPRGVALTFDNEHIVLSYGFERPTLQLVSAKTFTLIDGRRWDAPCQGSHLFMHDIEV